MKTLVCILISLSFYYSVALAQPIETEQIVVTPYQEHIQRTGTLTFKRTLSLSFKSSGYLTALSVDSGDSFTKGQLLASLDTTELLEDKNSKYSQLLQAKRNAKRAAELLANSTGSQQALDNAETLVETSRAAYKIAFYNLEKAQIIAPFDGVVLNRSAELGELQAPGKQVLQVAALKNNWVVKVALTQFEIGQIQLGQKVEVILPYHKTLVGEVNRIPAIANTQGNLFMVDILLPELVKPKGLIAGQIAQIHINFTTDKLIYTLPIDALIGINEQGDAMIMMKQNQDFIQRSFPIYKIDGHYLYLEAQQNDRPMHVVTQGWQRLKVGAKQ